MAGENQISADVVDEISVRGQLLSLEHVGRSPLRWLVVVFGASFAVWHVLTNIWLVEPGLWQNAIHFGGFAFLAAITFGPFGRLGFSRRMFVLDFVYGILVAAAAIWVASAEGGIYERSLAVTGQSWQFSVVDWAAG
ncbi:MAG: TRAP transporter permease, partial [Alphaproteobacteria bacterium]|nr:TRAP transporter permease [Alphaproteobacteria bacterium]